MQTIIKIWFSLYAARRLYNEAVSVAEVICTRIICMFTLSGFEKFRLERVMACLKELFHPSQQNKLS